MNGIKCSTKRSTQNEKFNTIYDSYCDCVYQTAFYFTRRKDVAEEIMQDTFIELFEGIEEIKEETAENWLLRVAKNKALNWITRNAMETEKLKLLEADSDEVIAQDLEQKVLEEERLRNMGALSKEIFEELRKENENWYKAVTRVYCEKKPQREVAEEMDVSIEVLHATLYRARNWIKRHYGERFESFLNV